MAYGRAGEPPPGGYRPLQRIRAPSVDKLDLETGKRSLWKELMPSDPAGVETIGPILITPDAKTCIFGYHRMLADLYLVEGLK